MSHLAIEFSNTFRRVAQSVCFRPISDPSSASPWTSFLIITVWSISYIGMEAAVGGENLNFNPYGLSFQLAGWALFAWAIVLLSGQYSPQLTSAVAHIGILGVLFTLFCTIWFILVGPNNEPDEIATMRDGATLVLAISIYCIAVFRIGLNLWPKAVYARGARFLAATLLPGFLIPYQPTLYGDKTDWTRYDVWQLAENYASTQASDEKKTVSNELPIDYEAAFYKQTSFVEEEFNQLAATRPNLPDMYFLGVAPSSSEEVFRREVTSARAAFDDQFATTGRSAVLINHKDTLNETPLATATNLRLALQSISQKMDVEEDRLVLFVSTHGSKDSLFVHLPGFRLNQLSAAGLVGMLDASGIKNRIVIISACHSGSFIDDLQNDRTLILTASSEEQVSFGCSNERDWTYFGDALFNYGLLQTSSFPEAFEIARSKVGEWEKSQKQAASNPQISIGKDILTHINAYLAQLPPDPSRTGKRASIDYVRQ